MSTIESTGLRAGVAMVDITPEMGIQLAGDIGRYRPTEEIREKLYARAVVLESGETQVCLLSLDLCVANNYWSDEIRRRASERFGKTSGIRGFPKFCKFGYIPLLFRVGNFCPLHRRQLKCHLVLSWSLRRR